LALISLTNRQALKRASIIINLAGNAQIAAAELVTMETRQLATNYKISL
jgi:hypothetical protein